ncbi:hypothetical protein MFIFM68171_04900 [Madurella fahalii]|uniref:G domain-containing protein n=1 Tax=Madurella fahalii TaxID=1157608 RepID=A0ABQ0GA94_9PEZI
MSSHQRIVRLICIVIVAFLSLRISEHRTKNLIDAGIPVILLMGRSGVGKSTFIHKLGAVDTDTGLPPAIGHTLKSETAKITYYKGVAYGKDVHLVDTPGFDDDRMGDEDVLHALQEMMLKTHHGTKLLTGIIYMHDITQHLEHFQRLLGKDGLRHCVLVTTKWADLPSARVRSEQQSRLEDLKENYWKTMLAHGSQVLEHDNTTDSALNIVNILLSKRRVIEPQIESSSDGAQEKEHGKIEPEVIVGRIIPNSVRIVEGSLVGLLLLVVILI